jgi:hypothetical protein
MFRAMNPSAMQLARLARLAQLGDIDAQALLFTLRKKAGFGDSRHTVRPRGLRPVSP